MRKNLADGALYRFHGRRNPQDRARTPIRAQVDPPEIADGVATLRLYDPIDSWGDFWGVSASEFARTLADLPAVGQINLHINSPGGEVYDGIAIMNQLRAHPARVTAIVDGIAASAASFIAVAADELVMGQNSELMIHDAWGICIGAAVDMRDLADRLDGISNNIASVYQAKGGGELLDWRSAMLAETWYSADEAVAAGLADRIAGDDDTADQADDAEQIAAAFDLDVFTYPGRAAAPGPVSEPAAAAGSRALIDARRPLARERALRKHLPKPA